MIGDQKYYMGLTSEKRNGDWVEMTFYTGSLDYFARWLLSFGNQVNVMSPPALKTRIKELLKEPVIFDGRNLYDLGEMKELGFHYESIGRG